MSVSRAKHPADLAALGTFIRTRRQELGLTQSELGARLGYVQERVSLLEHGKYGMPSLPALAAMAEALELPLGKILQAAGYSVPLTDPNVASRMAGERSGEAAAGVQRLYTQSERLLRNMTLLQDQLHHAQRSLERADAMRSEMAIRREHLASLLEACRGVSGESA